MKYLLDTHLLIWSAFDDERLPNAVARILGNPKSELFFSVISIWETAIKQSLGRKDFQADAEVLRLGLLTGGYREVLINSEHALEERSLARLHRDPFDRMLIAQANVEGLVLLTSDANILKYEGSIKRV